MRWKEINEAREAPEALLPPTPENEQKAKQFVMRKWIERGQERHVSDRKYHSIVLKKDIGDFVPPEDLSNGCKFSSLFASIVFGGKMAGNYDHYFVILPNGEKFDLNKEAKDVRDMMASYAAKAGEDPYRIDQLFMHQALQSDRRDVANRVTKWLNEFCAENGLPNRFKRSSTGNIIPTDVPVSETKEAPTIADATENGAKGINRKMANKMVDPKGYFHPKLP